MTVNIDEYMRFDEVRYKCADTAPEWFRDAVREAHDGELPNDWRFSVIHGLLVSLIEYSDGDDFPAAVQRVRDEALHELVEREVDIYYDTLLRWLADVPSRMSYVDEAYTTHFETGWPGFSELLSVAQFVAVDWMAHALTDAILANW